MTYEISSVNSGKSTLTSTCSVYELKERQEIYLLAYSITDLLKKQTAG